MNQVNCPVCGKKCVKSGKTKAGSQRWLCKVCKTSLTHKIDNDAKELLLFLDWLFGKESQVSMPGEGRTFRRKTARFWEIWPMPPKVEESKNVLFLDGIYLGRKACILICCDEKYVLGWYLCRYEHAGAWIALMKRIAEPAMVVSDGGAGFAKALKKIWPNAQHQRCVFHVFCQVKRYTTSRPNTMAGIELYSLAKDLMKVKSRKEAEKWVDRFLEWVQKYQKFLSEMTIDEYGNKRPTHERLLKAERSIYKLIRENTLFTYLDEKLNAEFAAPSTNNRIEGGINSRLREMLRNHRGLSIERRIKAVYWWCYMHSPEPLSSSEILKIMPTDKSIAVIYQRMNEKHRLEKNLSIWGDAIVWSDLHNMDKTFNDWD
ncbi:MAG: IS1249 family transposase [Lachnospiraceae bacterium]|nr:IS1249 family transposase [Lachnospiraceae bacterium]